MHGSCDTNWKYHVAARKPYVVPIILSEKCLKIGQ